MAIGEHFNALQDDDGVDGEKSFLKMGSEAITFGIKTYLAYTRKNIDKIGELISSIKC